MQNNSQNFSVQEIMRIAQSPAGKQLLTLLKQQQPSELERITHLAAAGNFTQAKEILNQMLNTESGRKLMEQLGEQNG